MDAFREFVIYSDTHDFGGHELMTLRHLEQSGGKGKIRVVINSGNKMFESKLKEYDNLFLLTGISFRCSKIPLLKQLLNFHKVIRQLKGLKSKNLIVLQGNLDSAILGLLAGKLLGRKVISYVPLTQPFVTTGAKFPRLRDTFVKHFVSRLVDHYITISDDLKENLMVMGVGPNKISIVRNTVSNKMSKKSIPSSQAFNKEKFTVLVPGRIYFKQKGQDYVIDEIKRIKNLENYQFIFVGSGPDEAVLRSRVLKDKMLNDAVTIMGWRDDMELLIKEADLVVLASRYEGVPMLMLETLREGTRLITSDCCSFPEYVSDTNRFQVGEKFSLADLVMKTYETRKDHRGSEGVNMGADPYMEGARFFKIIGAL